MWPRLQAAISARPRTPRLVPFKLFSSIFAIALFSVGEPWCELHTAIKHSFSTSLSASLAQV